MTLWQIVENRHAGRIITGWMMAVELYEVILSGTLAGQFVQTVLNVVVDNTTSEQPFEVAKDLADTFNSTGELIETWCAAMPVPYTLTSLRVRRVQNTGGPVYIILGGALIETAGQRTGNISASQVSPIIVWLNNLLPSKTGRTFIPGVSETDIENMVIQSGLLAKLNDLGTYWVNGATTGGFGFVWSGGFHRRVADTFTTLSAHRISPIIGTQRRRLRPV